MTSESGSCSNLVTVRQSDFEVFDALASDGRAAISDDSAETSMKLNLVPVAWVVDVTLLSVYCICDVCALF